MEWEQYGALDVTKHLVETGAVGANDFLYRMQINRDSGASLIALIAIKPDHPKSPPVFCLNLHWNGEYNIHNSEYIRVGYPRAKQSEFFFLQAGIRKQKAKIKKSSTSILGLGTSNLILSRAVFPSF